MTSMAAAACTQRGCGGTIEDGYCTICGLAPSSAASGRCVARRRRRRRCRQRRPSPLRRPRRRRCRCRRRRCRGRSASAAARAAEARARAAADCPGAGSAPGWSRCRSVPALDPASAVLADPRVPENKRFCGHCGSSSGRHGTAGPADRGVLPALRYPLLLRAQARAGRAGGRAVRGPRLPRARRTRLDLPGQGPQRQRPLGRAQGPAQHRGPGRDGGRHRRAAASWPRSSTPTSSRSSTSCSTPAARRRVGRLHRDGVRRRQVAEADPAGGAPAPRGRCRSAHALAYMLEILPALGYLHDRGLVYCDFKPDNVIQTEEQLKLIDLGGVRASTTTGPIYGTAGYQAPEIETDGPRQLRPVHRRPHAGRAHLRLRLPGGVQVPAARRRAAAAGARVVRPVAAPRHPPRPGRRFQSAGEMTEQLTGVLEEVLSVADGEPRPPSPACSARSCARSAST